ncbi:EexN family lipoprotein [Enterovibrio calviensis]|uniref:EexN family lipoprotein n=1 Tax=Enterovibrio calviensis TaxID=91359 RepID=UPI003736AF58
MKKHIALGVASLFLIACSDEEVARDRDWYMENPEAMELKAKECRNDARIADTPNCKNAMSANSELAILKMFN